MRPVGASTSTLVQALRIDGGTVSPRAGRSALRLKVDGPCIEVGKQRIARKGRAGEVRDNSQMESVFSSRKTERTARKVYRAEQDRSHMCDCSSTPRRAATRRSDTSIR
jgi:hypothetical protein